MTNRQHKPTEVVIVGGGLAGLTAAAFLARAGRSVVVVEQNHQPGGRAKTQVKDGFHFNLGPHALYRAGAGRKILRELGVEFRATVPDARGYAIKNGRKYKLLTDVWSMLTSRVVGLPAKFELARFLSSFDKLDPQALQNVTLQDWLEREIQRAEAREVVEALFRLFTYANAPNLQSAGAGIVQGQLAAAKNVYYIDGGWQTIIDGLRRKAENAGASVITGAKVKRIEWDTITGVQAVHMAGGTTRPASAVIIAAGPSVACKLVDQGHKTILQEWSNAAQPITAACLDIALEHLPNPQALFALGIGQPLYFSVHSRAARLAPEDKALIHAAKYLPVDKKTDPQADEEELNAMLDLLQPGWRELMVQRRFLPRLVVTHAVITAKQGGTAGRPGPEVPGIPNLYVAGDWVGPEGMLSDASFASGKQAAEIIMKTSSSSPALLQIPYENSMELAGTLEESAYEQN